MANNKPICPYFKNLHISKVFSNIECKKGEIHQCKYFLQDIDSGIKAQSHHDKFCCQHYTSCKKYKGLEQEGRAICGK